MFLSWLFTRNTKIAAIGLSEVLTKLVLCYVHERLWNRVSLGRTVESDTVPIAPATEEVPAKVVATGDAANGTPAATDGLSDP